jgi:hypothetical protein
MKKAHFYISLILCFGFFAFSGFDCEVSTPYRFVVESTYDNFDGRYYIDGDLVEYFEGSLEYTDSDGTNYYYYEAEVDSFTSIKVYANKDSEAAYLEVSIWVDSQQVESESSDSYDCSDYDTDDDGDSYCASYVSTVGPVYYEYDSSDFDDDSDDE